MATDWGTVDAVCPFYKTEDSIRIVCEGVSPRSTSNNVFNSSKGKDRYKESHCNSMSGCYECILFQALIKKY